MTGAVRIVTGRASGLERGMDVRLLQQCREFEMTVETNRLGGLSKKRFLVRFVRIVTNRATSGRDRAVGDFELKMIVVAVSAQLFES